MVRLKQVFRNGFNPETRLFKKETVLGEFASLNKLKAFLKEEFNYNNPKLFIGFKPVNDEYMAFDLFNRWG